MQQSQKAHEKMAKFDLLFESLKADVPKIERAEIQTLDNKYDIKTICICKNNDTLYIIVYYTKKFY